ncbi:MAG: glycosyltransferase [Bryobacteraceae bacterium]|nr:glycosyltransferase [Bryobacteraceae bacterium]
MRILFFAPHQLWPLTTGARVRDFHLARALAKRCEVTFLELLHPNDSKAAAVPEAGFARVVTASRGRTYGPGQLLRGLVGPLPVTAWNCYSREAAKQLERLLEEHRFDAVHIVGSPLAAYLPLVLRAPGRPAVLMDWHNIESVLMRRYAQKAPSLAHRLFALRTARLLEKLENRLLAVCGAHVTVSENDRQALLVRCPGAQVHCIPNGVDVRHYSEVCAANLNAAGGEPRNTRRRLLFVGSMDYFANIDGVRWFCQRVWPELETKHPDLDFVIVGRNPAPEVRALASPRVMVTGEVEDTRPFYRGAEAAVVPLRVGGGSRLKVLEAMAAGVPVISTRLGAEGLEAEPNEHYLLADEADEMARAIDRLLSSREVARALSGAAQQFVSVRYDWETLGRRLADLHQQEWLRLSNKGALDPP